MAIVHMSRTDSVTQVVTDIWFTMKNPVPKNVRLEKEYLIEALSMGVHEKLTYSLSKGYGQSRIYLHASKISETLCENWLVLPLLQKKVSSEVRVMSCPLPRSRPPHSVQQVVCLALLAHSALE